MHELEILFIWVTGSDKLLSQHPFAFWITRMATVCVFFLSLSLHARACERTRTCVCVVVRVRACTRSSTFVCVCVCVCVCVKFNNSKKHVWTIASLIPYRVDDAVKEQKLRIVLLMFWAQSIARGYIRAEKKKKKKRVKNLKALTNNEK